jgi:hypothetical protein
MPDETKPKSFWPLVWKTGAVLFLSFLSMIGGFLWKELDAFRGEWGALNRRLESLEDDKAKWATLADMERKILELRVQTEVMRQVWSYEYGRSVPSGFSPKQGHPVLTPPEDLFRDIEKYRAYQQNKIPAK